MSTHGTAGYASGCRCEVCRKAHYRYMSRYHHDRNTIGRRLVDATQTILQLQRWRDQGWSVAAISQATGVLDRHIYNLCLGHHSSLQQHTVARVMGTTMDDLLQVDGGAQVPSYLASRRLRALKALGWTWRDLAEHTGLTTDAIQAVTAARRTGTQTNGSTLQAVRRTYDQLSMTRAPEGRTAAIARASAARAGYAPPLAWDDIDDPDEQPTGIRPIGARDQKRSRYGDTAEVILELVDRGDDLQGIMAHLGVTRDGVYKACRRSGRLDVWDRLMGRREAA